MLDQDQSKIEDLLSSSEQSASLRVIGDRASGKTTYMAALAHWSNTNSSSPVQSVIPIGSDSEKLKSKAQNLLEQGLPLEPTPFEANPNHVKDYVFTIILKQQFSWQSLSGKTAVNKLTISCKDYSGEFLSDLLLRSDNSMLLDYLNDYSRARGILFLVDGVAYQKDTEYATCISKLLTTLNRTKLDNVKHRIAMVLTKCELPELWVDRNRPSFLAEARFPKSYQEFQSWQQTGAGEVDYFMASAFGMLNSQVPEPNSTRISRRREGMHSKLKDPKNWQPFGLVSPIYWLCTGKRHPELDRD